MKNRFYVPTNQAVETDGVVYVAGSDIFAIDASSGKVKWASKAKSLGLVSGLEASGGTVIARQGRLDSTGSGAPTAVVTQLLGPEFEEGWSI
jgi:outer membrane protein assembly factor BamB